MKRLLPAVPLGIVGLVGLLHCTSTVNGTGAPDGTGDAGASTGCGAIAGSWQPPTRTTPDSCPKDVCTIAQNGCELTVVCPPKQGITGTISGDTAQWGDATGTCTAVLGAAGVRLAVSCSGVGGQSCSIELAKR